MLIIAINVTIKYKKWTLRGLELLLCHQPPEPVYVTSPATMWLLGLLRLACSLVVCCALWYMWIVSAVVCWQIMYCPPSVVPLSSQLPHKSLTPKLPIKTNLAPREIKPTLAEKWHRLQLSHCALCVSHSTTLFVFATDCLCHSYFFLPDTHLPLAADDCAAA